MTSFGFHGGPGGNHNGLGDYFRALDAAGIPATAKSTDDFGQVRELADLERVSGVPHNKIFRITMGRDGASLDVPPYHLSPSEAAQAHWQRTKFSLPPEFTHYKDTVWLELVNELDQDRADWIGSFCVEIANLARAEGYRVALPSWSSGTPMYDGWETPGSLAFLRLCAQYPNDVALSLHEYSYDVNDIQNITPHLIGRFAAYTFDVCAANGISFPTTFITEWGWTYNDVPNDVDQAMADVAWAYSVYKPYPQVKGVALWYLGAEYGGIANEAQRLIAPMTQFMLDNGTAPPPEPLPLPSGRGEPRVQYERVYVLLAPDHDEPWAYAVIDGSWRNKRYTLGGSADDAGIGNLGIRRVLAVNPEEWGPGDDGTGLSGFYRQYYPGIIYEPIKVGTPAELRAFLAGEVPAPPPSSFRFEYWPTEFKVITQPFGANHDYYWTEFGLPGHEGIDFKAPGNTKIFAVAPGVVSQVHTDPLTHNYGIFVRVDHVDSYQTTYAHLKQPLVVKGQVVAAGEVLGLADDTGNSFGNHLHLILKRLGYFYPAPAGSELDYWPYSIFDPTPFISTGLPIPVQGGGEVRIGLHGRADGGDMPEADIMEFRTMKPEVIKVLSSTSGTSIARLAGEHPGVPFIIRAFLHFGGRVITPEQFYNDTIGDVERAVNHVGGGREVWVEIHNEPNLVEEGWMASWADGTEFVNWASHVLSRYRGRLPSYINYMYPGLSPGGDVAGVRMNHWSFFDQGAQQWSNYQGIGVHAYWADAYPMSQAVDTVSWFARKLPSKPIWVTEASRNDRPEVVAANVYAQEYMAFTTALKSWPNVAGVTYFIVSASNPFFHPECWVVDNNSKGIGAIIGAR